ncbi:flagellar protein FlgN [Porticoccus sp. W117]|uniref:flagella synthesis protein FlgN n=1 Tax=Porticoccus sp. W117 TaxID=3054777 RepID=UPI00259ABF06|nr:flagellar protein FlgN [Porticoccus sp. W117]MDM3871028.1 flagellar protein FlgN [Porticoccus sp. W117]
MTTNTLQLQQQLQQELELTQALQQCLGKERKALEQQDTESLVENANHKGQLVQQLEAAARQRENLLTQAGYAADREGMQQLLAGNKHSQLEDIWQKLSSAAEQCRAENRQLGMLIQREQGSVRQAQHILQRGAPADNHSYNASGQSNSSAAKSRNIGKA